MIWVIARYDHTGRPVGAPARFRGRERFLRNLSVFLQKLADDLHKRAPEIKAADPQASVALERVAMIMDGLLELEQPINAYKIFKFYECNYLHVGGVSWAGGIMVIPDPTKPWEEAGEAERQEEELGMSGPRDRFIREGWRTVFFDMDGKVVSEAFFTDFNRMVRSLSEKLADYAEAVERHIDAAEDQNPEYAVSLANLAEGIRIAAKNNAPFRALNWFD